MKIEKGALRSLSLNFRERVGVRVFP